MNLRATAALTLAVLLTACGGGESDNDCTAVPPCAEQDASPPVTTVPVPAANCQALGACL